MKNRKLVGVDASNEDLPSPTNVKSMFASRNHASPSISNNPISPKKSS
jgi:hypothetical protein